MAEYDVLQMALIRSMEKEVWLIEKDVKDIRCEISTSCENAMQQLISDYRRGDVKDVPEYYKPHFEKNT